MRKGVKTILNTYVMRRWNNMVTSEIELTELDKSTSTSAYVDVKKIHLEKKMYELEIQIRNEFDILLCVLEELGLITNVNVTRLDK